MNICLSFDDGRIDQYTVAYPILLKYKFPATFFITTGFVDGSFKSDCFGKGRKPISAVGILDMYNSGMEIASHGDKHVMNIDDYNNSINKLKKWGIHYDKYGFSVPNSNYEVETLLDFKAKCKTNLQYIRIGRNPICYSLINKIRYLIYNTFHLFASYNRFNKNNLVNFNNGAPLYSLVIKKSTLSKDIIRFIEMHKNDSCSLIIMFHSVLKKPTNKWEWSEYHFEHLCRYLSENTDTIFIQTIKDLVC